MLRVHTAPTSISSSLLMPLARGRDKGNIAWLDAALKNQSEDSGSILLLGGANLTHFRLRVAQSHARSDLLPSFWSHVAILSANSARTLHEVSVEPAGGFRAVPQSQGIRLGTVAAYDDPEEFPNIALILWKLKPGSLDRSFETATADVIRRLYKDRGTVDIPSALLAWIGYAWGVGDQSNPLLRGIGIPSAVFVETVFSMLGIEVTPGLASQSSCPEAIWQAAKWWGDFYDSDATLTEGRPTGFYHVGQPAAAVTYEESAPSFTAPVRGLRTKSGHRKPKK